MYCFFMNWPLVPSEGTGAICARPAWAKGASHSFWGGAERPSGSRARGVAPTVRPALPGRAASPEARTSVEGMWAAHNVRSRFANAFGFLGPGPG